MNGNTLVVDKQKINTALQMNAPITIQTYTLPKDMALHIEKTASEILEILKQTQIKEYFLYCLKELLTNAKKANTKRVFFKKKGLDIFDDKDFEKGMKTFKEETLKDIDYYLELQRTENLYIKTTFKVVNRAIVLEVRNNSPLTVMEFKRVFDKIVRASQYENIKDAFSQILDETEGAGLGLVIMVLMLRKIGLDENAFSISVDGNETVSRVTMPLDLEIQKQVVFLTKEIADSIKAIPQFPDKILELQRLLNNPNAQISSFVELISEDVTLTTELLKLVNSASFGLASKCMNITDAVKLLGTKGLENLLFSVGIIQILQKAGPSEKALWDKAYKAAFFSQNIAKLSSDKKVIGQAYVCGLLHDLGKIIFSTLFPKVLQKIEECKEEKNISPKVFERVLSGMEYQEMSLALATKWNLPQPIIKTIKYQYSFESAPQEFKGLIFTVGLASMMIEYTSENIEYYQISPILLDYFKISSEDKFKRICEQFEDRFASNNTRTSS